MYSLDVTDGLTAENYCDQKPITMNFTFEEHDLLNDILNHAIESFDFVAFLDEDELPEDGEIMKRKRMLENIKNRSFQLWKTRFDSPPYNNN